MSPTIGRSVVLMLTCAVLGAPATASMPPIPIPTWIQVELTARQPPEIGQRTSLQAQVMALLAPQPGARWEAVFPEGLEVLSGKTSGTLDLEPGHAVTLEFGVQARAPLSGANVVFRVTTRPPRDVLRKEAERLHTDEPVRDQAARLIEKLPEEDTQSRILGFTTTEEEATLAEAPDPAYRRYVADPGRTVRLALLDAMPGMTLEAVRARIQVATPKLTAFQRMSKGDPKEPLAGMVADLALDLAKLRYQEALLVLSAGDAKTALAILKEGSMVASKLPAPLETGRLVAIGAASFLAVDRQTSLDVFARVLAMPGLGPTARYVEFDSGEVLRSTGDVAGAREAYRRALGLAPAFSLARRRLAECR
ncbi:MAG: hypothetical protein HY815_25570 [Candidatus Riflebacteria bacterium]|nr:hypothetical protein [Candidatus Riflebacteria bacterium]